MVAAAPKVARRRLPLPGNATKCLVMRDIIADWLSVVAGCGITAADLRRLRHHPEFKSADSLSGQVPLNPATIHRVTHISKNSPA